MWSALHVQSTDPTDRDEWLRLLVGLYPDHPTSEHGPAVIAFFDGRPFHELLPQAVFVAEWPAGGMAGFLELSGREYAEGCAVSAPYVESWCVDPDERGASIGRALMAAAEAWTRAGDTPNLPPTPGWTTPGARLPTTRSDSRKLRGQCTFARPCNAVARLSRR